MADYWSHLFAIDRGRLSLFNALVRDESLNLGLRSF